MHFFLKHYFRVVASGKKSKSLHNKLPHLIEDTSGGGSNFSIGENVCIKKIPSVGGPQAGGLEPRTGLEPVTYALRMRRSTN